MLLELHIIQNFSPSNLNRGEDNTPKDCSFGGHRRARVSSQCIKRSVRKHPTFTEAVRTAGGDLGIRTKRVKDEVLVKRMVEEAGKFPEEAQVVAANIIVLLGLGFKGEKTQYILYLGETELKKMFDIAIRNWDPLAKALITKNGTDDASEGEEVKTKGKKKKLSIPPALEAVKKELGEVVSSARKEANSYAADIALFGRMIADGKNMNVDAACQVAHAISTHKVEMELDYFTAVDDLLPDEESGSDMIGGVEFNSSCFYRYSIIDIEKLGENLGVANKDLLAGVVRGYIEASVKAVPTGKQNSMAAHNPPGFVRAILRKEGFPWNLANAFQKPVRATNDKSIEELSIERLNDYYNNLAGKYGAKGIACDVFFNVASPDGDNMNVLCDKIIQSIAGSDHE